jgi:hypothetical protein
VTTIALKRITSGTTGATVEIDGVLRTRVRDVHLIPRNLEVLVITDSEEVENGAFVTVTETFTGDNITITLE